MDAQDLPPVVVPAVGLAVVVPVLSKVIVEATLSVASDQGHMFPILREVALDQDEEEVVVIQPPDVQLRCPVTDKPGGGVTENP